MDMMGRVGVDRGADLDRAGSKSVDGSHDQGRKIAIPPGGTLEKGSLYSMFIRMLLHNAMEEQKRQEVLTWMTRTTNGRLLKTPASGVLSYTQELKHSEYASLLVAAALLDGRFETHLMVSVSLAIRDVSFPTSISPSIRP